MSANAGVPDGPHGVSASSPRQAARKADVSSEAVALLASEYLSLCNRLEDHAGELKFLADASSRPVLPPTTSTSSANTRGRKGGTPDRCWRTLGATSKDTTPERSWRAVVCSTPATGGGAGSFLAPPKHSVAASGPGTPERSRRALLSACQPARGGKDLTPERNWRSTFGTANDTKDTTPERNWRTLGQIKDSKDRKDVTPERGWRTGLTRGTTTNDRPLGSRSSGMTSTASTSCGSLGSKDMTPERSWRDPRPLGRLSGSGSTLTPSLGLRAPTQLTAPRTAPAVQQNNTAGSTVEAPSQEDSVIQGLMKKGFLSTASQLWKDGDALSIPPQGDDLAQVKAWFEMQAPSTLVHGVYRVENSGLGVVYNAFRSSLGERTERHLWHGTSAESVQNITLNGFNRAYCGRHGMKYGQGSYFSATAAYSVRFCDRRRVRRLMFLAKVIVGKYTRGSPDMVEAPHKDNDCLSRYDSTVDDVDAPNIFCVFRDFQAIPLYLVEFSVSNAAP